MPLVVKFRPEAFILSDIWIDKESALGMTDDLTGGMLEVFNDSIRDFLDEFGGLQGIVQSVEWAFESNCRKEK